MRVFKWIIILTLFTLMIVNFTFACPACKDALATEEARALAQGYFWSIMVMLSMPFLLTGTVAFFIVRAYKKTKLFENLSVPLSPDETLS